MEKFERVLINGNSKALRKGKTVKATGPGEYVYSTQSGNDVSNGQELTIAQLQDVATANKCKFVKKDNRATLVAKLETHFNQMEIDIMNDKTSQEIVAEICDKHAKSGEYDANAIQIEIVSTGKVKFKEAIKLFKTYSEEKGYLLSNTKRIDSIKAHLTKVDFNPGEDSEALNAMIEEVTKEVASCDEKQAWSGIRKWAKENNVELPKRKGASKGSFRDRMLTWVANNPGADLDAIKAAVKANGRKEEQVDTTANRYLPMVEVVTMAVEIATKKDDSDDAGDQAA